MISRDESILEPNSVSAGRMAEYGDLCEELHIIIFSGRGFQDKSLSKNVFVHPTNSFLKLFSIFTACRIGRKIIGNWKLEIGNCVVTTQDPFETGLVGLRLKRKFNIGLNVQLHGDFFGNPYFWAESFLNKIRLRAAKKVIKNADSIRVVSQRIKKTLKPLIFNLKPEIAVIPIYTDIQKIQITPPAFNLRQKYPDSNLILLWAGRMGKVKNLSFLLQAFKHVLDAFPRAILVLVGSGPEEARLKEDAKRLGVVNSVKFEGEQTDLISYYKTADIFVFPSLYEGWGRVVIEAAAAGLPVVMSDVGCAGEIIQDEISGRVAKVNDLAGFVRAITELCFNPDLRLKYRQAAQEAVGGLPNKEKTFKLIKKSWELCVYQ